MRSVAKIGLQSNGSRVILHFRVDFERKNCRRIFLVAPLMGQTRFYMSFFVPSSGRHGFEALLSSFAALVGVKQGFCTLFEPF